jgi:hypothetical protein
MRSLESGEQGGTDPAEQLAECRGGGKYEIGAPPLVGEGTLTCIQAVDLIRGRRRGSHRVRGLVLRNKVNLEGRQPDIMPFKQPDGALVTINVSPEFITICRQLARDRPTLRPRK